MFEKNRYFAVPTVPRNVKARSINSTAIQISWMEPEFPNGVIVYHLFYRQQGEEDMKLAFAGSEKQFVVTGLKLIIAYEFKVEAYNIRLGKSGPNQTIVARTSSAGNIK